MIRVVTWNIRTGVGNDPHEPEKHTAPDIERVALVIRSLRPDVVALQEVDRNRDRTNFVDQTAELERLLGMAGRFAPNLVDAAGEYGIATFSPHRIVVSEHSRFPRFDGWEPRGLLDMVIDVRGRHIRVLNTHLQVGEGEEARTQREDAANVIALRMRGSIEPVVLMGDFNAEPSSPELRPLAESLDAWAEKGGGDGGRTIPASPFENPTGRIDAIYVDQSFIVRDCAVIRTPETELASDHYPVAADLVLVDSSGLSVRV